MKLANEIASMATAVIRRLDLTGAAVPVILGGGVLAASNPLLIGAISERVSARGEPGPVQGRRGDPGGWRGADGP